MKFEPILEDKPISFAYDRPQFFRNAEREKRWGVPVYFVPSSNKYDEVGQAYYGYVYGSKCDDTKGKYGNCTAWAMGSHQMRSGQLLKECVGDAFQVYAKYKGRKDGGVNGKYIGDTLQQGDMLIYKDGGAGHINVCERIQDGKVTLSESGYSRNSVYKGKACIVYDINLKDLIVGKTLTLRPKSPYNIEFYGIIHTGDVFDDYILPKAVERDTTKDQLYVGDIILNVRDEATTSSQLMGRLEKPNGYFNVNSVVKKDDYTWYSLGVDSWVAGVNEVTFYPKAKEKDYQKLYEIEKEKTEKIKEIVNVNN